MTENHELDTATQVFFYEREYYFLSNLAAFRLHWKGIDHDTSEAAYHCEKFPHLPDFQQRIRSARSAHDAFELAQTRKDDMREDWYDVRVTIMRSILRAKCEQHEHIRLKLLESGERELIEDSWRDSFWGWGPNRDGQNVLGKLWMEIRSELKSSGAS